jgi:DnaJ-class molecular chaperone
MTTNNTNPCILCKGKGLFRRVECPRCKGKGSDPWKPRAAERAVKTELELRRHAVEKNLTNYSYLLKTLNSKNSITKGIDKKSVDLNEVEDRKYKLSICQKCNGTGGPRSNCSNCGGSGWVG